LPRPFWVFILETGLKRVGKGAGFAFRIAVYILTTFTAGFLVRPPRRARAVVLQIDSMISRWLLKGLDVHVRVMHIPLTLHSGRPHFFVVNHVSDVDILALQSITPMVFITSIEVRDYSFLGTLAIVGGCFFVERRNKFGALSEIERLAQVLREGSDVILFAEGTSSNGEGVLPLKNTLLQAAIEAEAVLVPVCINYRTIDGQPVTVANRDRIFYYGDMGFGAHLWRLLGARALEVECRFLEPLPLVRTDDRKEICDRVYRGIAENYTPIK
jgi:1-acyl-sn-glycerol-3-phosphate acyltransferase